MSLRNASGRSSRQPSIVDFYDPQVNGADANGRTRAQIVRWDDDMLEQCHDYIQVLFPLPESSMFSYNAPQIDSNTMQAFRSNTDLQVALCSAFVRMLAFYGFEARVNVDSKASLGSADDEERTQLQEPEKGKEKADTLDGTEPSSQVNGSLNQHPETPNTLKTLSEAPSDMKDVWHAIDSFHIVRGANFEERSMNWCVRIDHNHLRITRILRCLRVLGLQKQSEEFHKALGEVFDDPGIHIGERSMMFWTRAVREPLHIAPDGKECRWLRRWQEEKHQLD